MAAMGMRVLQGPIFIVVDFCRVEISRPRNETTTVSHCSYYINLWLLLGQSTLLAIHFKRC